MLDTLRANSRSVLTYVLFGIIIVVFVISFGPGSKGCSGGGASAESWAAKVDGTAIPPAEFEQQYVQLVRMYSQGGAQDLNVLLQAQIRRVAMDQVVQRQLIEDEAKRQGLVVTDEDVSDAIKKLPAFQSDGRFDHELYKRAVTNAYGSPGKFEERMRGDLAFQRMLAVVRTGARVSEDEVKEAWTAENDRLALELARFNVALARKDVKVSDAEVKAFAAANGPRIEKYYQDNKSRFDQPQKIRARHILAQAAEDAPQAEQDAARKKIDDALARLKKGEDFAKVASELSDDPGSKTRGGDLGFFGPGAMVKPFEDAAGKLKPGQVSDPVRTSFGWHLIKVEAIEPAKLTSLDEARPIIAKELLEIEEAKKLARAKAEEVLKQAKAGKSLADLLPPADPKTKKAKVELGGQPVVAEETGSFPASSSPNVPKVGPAADLFADAVKANAGQVLPQVYSTSDGNVLVVARVKDRQRPDAAKFAERKADVETRLRMRREAEQERAFVEALRKKAKVQMNDAFLAGTARRGGSQVED